MYVLAWYDVVTMTKDKRVDLRASQLEAHMLEEFAKDCGLSKTASIWAAVRFAYLYFDLFNLWLTSKSGLSSLTKRENR